jgi:hypothetical protein
LSTEFVLAISIGSSNRNPIKKADVAGHPKVSRHVGLLLNEPPCKSGDALYLVGR